VKEGIMKEKYEEKREEKRAYEKPELTRHGKLTDVTGLGSIHILPPGSCVY